MLSAEALRHVQSRRKSTSLHDSDISPSDVSNDGNNGVVIRIDEEIRMQDGEGLRGPSCCYLQRKRKSLRAEETNTFAIAEARSPVRVVPDVLYDGDY